MRTIKFASKIKKVKVDNKLERREFFYAIIDNNTKYIGFYLEDVPLGLMSKAWVEDVEKDIYDDNDEFVETIIVKEKRGQLDFFNKGGITYIRPNGRFHYLGNRIPTTKNIESKRNKQIAVD